MSYKLPALPYAQDALEPHISRETVGFHYGKHHAGYVKKLNELLKGHKLEDATLEEIVRRSSGEIFNNAAQVWNHNFYWQCLSPRGGGEPSGDLASEIKSAFTSFAAFRKKFAEIGEHTFGSGWTWLVRNSAGSLEIVSTQNAETPIKAGQTALLTCDVWEHSYYIDYRNSRPDYIKAYWNLVNWQFVAQNATQTSKTSARNRVTA